MLAASGVAGRRTVKNGWPQNLVGHDMGVSLNGGTPISHPKMIIFSRKNQWLLGTTIFRNPPYGFMGGSVFFCTICVFFF